MQQRKLSKADDCGMLLYQLESWGPRGLLPKSSSKGELFESVLGFFGVADRNAWERIWTQPVTSFRKHTPPFCE